MRILDAVNAKIMGVALSPETSRERTKKVAKNNISNGFVGYVNPAHINYVNDTSNDPAAEVASETMVDARSLALRAARHKVGRH